MTLAFYVATEGEFEDLLAKLKNIDVELFESLPTRVKFRDRTVAAVGDEGEQDAGDEMLLIN
jgi:hypothetical protein